MRISQQAKQHNRQRILEAARLLFADRGFEATTTRDIAQAAGLAVGTLFNYFPTKEAVAMTMVNDALARGREDYLRRRSGDEGLAEDLFLFLSSGLRRMRPLRPFIGPALERSLSPFAGKTLCPEGEAAKEEHLTVVREIIARQGYSRVPALVSLHLYWSLYLGILAFWSSDTSENLQQTLALLDYALTIYAQTLAHTTTEKGTTDDAHTG
ncbi:MAG: TetR/AcrR family transcriptional regulator [Thermodesulfobacteriota bacterium]